MKKSIPAFGLILTLLICFNLNATVQADPAIEGQGIQFFHGKWEDAVQKAEKEGKYIFVDFYTTWCGPCKYMSKKVFTSDEVGDFFNKHFVSVKIDAEKEEEELVESMKVEAIPVLAFFDSKGETMLVNTGAMDAPEFLDRAQLVVDYPSNKVKYESDPSDMDAMTSYLAILKQADPKTATGIIEDYLSALKEDAYLEPDNWELIRQFGLDYESDLFLHVLKHADTFQETFDLEVVNYMVEVLTGMWDEVLADHSTEKLGLFKDYYFTFLQTIGEDEYPRAFYDATHDIDFYEEAENWTAYMNTTDTWLTTYFADDWEELTTRAVSAADLVPDEDLGPAEEWMKKAIAVEDNLFTNYGYGYVLYWLDREDEGMKYAKKAHKLAKERGETELIELTEELVLDLEE